VRGWLVGESGYPDSSAGRPADLRCGRAVPVARCPHVRTSRCLAGGCPSPDIRTDPPDVRRILPLQTEPRCGREARFPFQWAGRTDPPDVRVRQALRRLSGYPDPSVLRSTRDCVSPVARCPHVRTSRCPASGRASPDIRTSPPDVRRFLPLQTEPRCGREARVPSRWAGRTDPPDVRRTGRSGPASKGHALRSPREGRPHRSQRCPPRPVATKSSIAVMRFRAPARPVRSTALRAAPARGCCAHPLPIPRVDRGAAAILSGDGGWWGMTAGGGCDLG